MNGYAGFVMQYLSPQSSLPEHLGSNSSPAINSLLGKGNFSNLHVAQKKNRTFIKLGEWGCWRNNQDKVARTQYKMISLRKNKEVIIGITKMATEQF